MKFNNKTVVVTGSGSGIGRATAICFAREGASLVIADINFDAAKQTVELIKKEKGKAVAFQADVSDPLSVQELVLFTIRAFSKVHTVVNNAAIQINKTAEDTSFEEWSRQLAVNLGGVFLCSKYFLPHLRETRRQYREYVVSQRFFC